MKTETKKTPKLRIIPLGGLEQIGMNITAFEYDDSIIVVDCGLWKKILTRSRALSLPTGMRITSAPCPIY